MTLSAISLALSVALVEVTLRIAFPPYRFLDPNADCFWTLRLREQMRNDPDGSAVYGSGQYDARIGWKPQSNRRSVGQNTNSRGIRGTREYTYAKPVNVRRYVVHGDSFTWGLGVDDEHTYSSRLSALLPRSEVVNMGINGHGIDQQYLYWLSEGILYQPDVVVLGFYVPDFHRAALSIREFPKPRFAFTGGELVLEQSPVPTPTTYLDDCDASCRSASRLRDLGAAALRKFRREEPEAAFEAKAQIHAAILAAWKRSLAPRTRLCVVVIPHARFRRYPNHARIEALLERTADELGCAFLNLTEPLREFESNGARAYQESNGHWTPAGHAFAARQIATLLGTMQIADEGAR